MFASFEDQKRTEIEKRRLLRLQQVINNLQQPEIVSNPNEKYVLGATTIKTSIETIN